MLPTIAEHAQQHDIRPNKKLGQNFLYDSSLCTKIALQSGKIAGNVVLEIGPGVAGLTRAILECNPKQLIVIEKDKRCIALLEEIKECYPQLTIINDDALKINITTLAAQYTQNKIKIISNLPYNIGTKLLVGWLRHDHSIIDSITVMLQKEVVERALAQAGNKNYGRLSIWCTLLANAVKCFDVAPTAFYPPPKVYSAILHLSPYSQNTLDDKTQHTLQQLLLSAFSARRKLFLKSLKALTPDATDILHQLDISQDIRPDRITPDQYLQITQLINQHITQ